MAFVIYRRNGMGALHVRDDNGNHWTLRETSRGRDVRDLSDGSWIDPQREILLRNPTIFHKDERRKKKGTRAYSRLAGTAQYYWFLPSFRGTTHGLMNLVTQEGSWAWYTGFGGRKRQDGDVKATYVPARKQGTVMAEAARRELKITTSLSATEYARRGHGSWLTSGHSSIPYEWCHLVAHGMGGPDAPENLVAATCYQNTEQFIIECVLYGYREEGLSVEVHAKLAKGTLHLAESIWYKILLGHEIVWTKTMDARRATRPTWSEYRDTARLICTAINNALERRYEDVTDYQYDHLEYIETNVVNTTNADGSDSFWSA